MPAAMPKKHSSVVSVRRDRTIRSLLAPRDLSTPMSRVRSRTVVYMVRKMTRRPMETARAIMELMKVCTRPEHADDVIEEMKATFPTYPVRPLKDFMTLMTSTNIPALQTFINSMIALAVSIGLLVIFLTMYTTVLERTRDIGVLKSLGASKLLIVRSLLTETTLLCFFGIAAGIGLSYLVRAGFLALFPTLSILITPEWLIRAACISLVGAVLGASYPAWLASRKDPVEALTYD